MGQSLCFQWECQPKAENLILRALQQCKESNLFISALEEDLNRHTSTQLFDWLDHLVLGNSPQLQTNLEECGFVANLVTPNYRVFHHPGAQLPRLLVKDRDHPVGGIAVSVEAISDFLMVRGLTNRIEGSPLSGYRRCCVSTENCVSLWAIERRGILEMEPTHSNSSEIEKYLKCREKWDTRPRGLDNEDEALERTLVIAEEIITSCGQNLAAWIVLEGERKYWQSRNSAGQIQKNRQDRLGMGWANHDHHTFRSSRKHFRQLVRLFEMLGFHCRERYYAGKEAGWGAQIMENPHCKLVLFLDVDLAPNELEIDFAHQPLPELPTVGTIGLWCELHGDSILKAGMHHLEAQFLFESLAHDLAHAKIRMMEPFSSFDYLKQAFTEGEIWPVNPEKIAKLVKNGKVSKEQGDKFLAYGAVGSHLENLQRREG